MGNPSSALHCTEYQTKSLERPENFTESTVALWFPLLPGGLAQTAPSHSSPCCSLSTARSCPQPLSWLSPDTPSSTLTPSLPSRLHQGQLLCEACPDQPTSYCSPPSPAHPDPTDALPLRLLTLLSLYIVSTVPYLPIPAVM